MYLAADDARFEVAMREDGWAEWATFCAFLLAAVIGSFALIRSVFGRLASGQRSKWPRSGAIFLLALFSAFAAGEEISWGQRVFGFMPPEVFQQQNLQQELNFHNFLPHYVSTEWIFVAIAVGYGVAMPLAARVLNASGTVGSILQSVAPPLFLSPWFAVTALVYVTNPVLMGWEAAELSLGLLILCHVLLLCLQPGVTTLRSARTAKCLMATLSLPLIAGAACNPILDRIVFGVDESNVRLAHDELRTIADALKQTAAIHPAIPEADRRLHWRIFDAVKRDLIRFRPAPNSNDSPNTVDSAQRRTYFLDPWNNPYWICFKGTEPPLLYSYGPNRHRDTIMMLVDENLPFHAEMTGDDIALVFDFPVPPAEFNDQDD